VPAEDCAWSGGVPKGSLCVRKVRLGVRLAGDKKTTLRARTLRWRNRAWRRTAASSRSQLD